MRIKIWTLLVVLTLPVLKVAAGEQDTNRGFNPSGMYATGDIDTVNLFNGNLVVNLPLSPSSYPLNGGFSYGVHLIYTGNPWDFLSDQTPNQTYPTKYPYPNRRSNAGLGWRVSMGQMRIPGGPLGSSTGYSYESPDGSVHPFWSTMHPSDTPDPSGNVYYTRDATYLRLIVSSTSLDMAFPDGLIHSFDPATGQLQSIRTPFDSPSAPSVTVAYKSGETACQASGADSCWEITDATSSPSRVHRVTFKNDDHLFSGVRADKIILAGVGAYVRTYQLNYYDNGATTLATDSPQTCYVVGPATPPSYVVPLLSGVTLPDGTNYSFTYFTNPVYCSEGSLQTLGLPTGGSIEYTYKNYMEAIGSYQVPSVPGVQTRTRKDGSGSPNPPQWIYTPTAGDIAALDQADNNRDPETYSDLNPTFSECSITKDQYREMTVSVLNPDFSVVKNYFSTARVSSWRYCPGFRDEPWVGLEYGAPITHRAGTTNPNLSGKRALSSQTYDPQGNLVRSSYLTYENDASNSFANGGNRRVVGSATVFEDDGGKVIDTRYSDFDGLGHYRQADITSTGFGSAARTTYTRYNDARGIYFPDNGTGFSMPPASAPWILNTFTYQQTSERDKAARSDACFTNGALTRSRARASAGGAAGASDLIHAYQLDTRGNRIVDSLYGGDTQTVGTADDLCTMSLPGTPVYEKRHTYTNGVLQASDYYSAGSAFLNILNLGVDRSGVVTSATDAAGIVTTYSYDALSRLQSVSTPGVTAKTYSYTPPVTSPSLTGAKVTETQGDLVNTYTYDGLGRLASESRLTPDGATATRSTDYDWADRKVKSHDWSVSGTGPETLMTYDSFGRMVSMTTPDAKVTQNLYAGTFHGGISSLVRRSEIATSLNGASSVDVTESYDAFGRLSSVAQKSGPTTSLSTTGAVVTTTYTYDVADRLAAVKMGANTGTVQNRIFDYDNRGFLRWESQPESGVTSYTYDAGGHVKSRLQSGANSLFDLTYTYDAAERPLTVNGRDPANTSAFRPIKEFAYGTQNNETLGLIDRSTGKLVSAKRHNYGDSNANYQPYGEPEYDVTDTYNYYDPAGRMTTRTTSLSMVTLAGTTQLKQFTMNMGYDGLGLPLNIDYPSCVGCGMPPADPDRSQMLRTYARGRLHSLTDYDAQSNASGYVSDISYWPNGMRNSLTHWAASPGHNIADIQTVADMPRPSALQFGVKDGQSYDRCVRPTFTLQPVSTTLTNGSATLQVTATGTTPMTYDWYTLSGLLINGANSSSITVQAGDYYAVARNACGYEASETAHVSSTCQAPSTGEVKAIRQPDGSWILKANPVATSQRTFCWSIVGNTGCLSSTETLAIGVQTATTTYRFTVTDGVGGSCGSASGDVTISVPLPTTNGMTATWTGSATNIGHIAVQWYPTVGTNQFVYRFHDGAWEFAGNAGSATSFDDYGIVAGKTYVYSVTSDIGGHTNYDVATTTTFTAAVSGQPISVDSINDMLLAANQVRAAAGWPALNWSNILSSTDPLPSPGNLITARQVMACRARINEALQALGVVVAGYTVPDLVNTPISAASINEVQQRAQ